MYKPFEKIIQFQNYTYNYVGRKSNHLNNKNNTNLLQTIHKHFSLFISC